MSQPLILSLFDEIVAIQDNEEVGSKVIRINRGGIAYQIHINHFKNGTTEVAIKPYPDKSNEGNY